MRIAMVSRALPAHGGGGMERLTADLSVAWAALGHEVVIYTTPTGSDAGFEQLERRGVAVVPLPGRPGRYSPEWRRAVRSAVQPTDHDVVLGVSSGAASVARAAGAPVIMQAHGTALGEVLSKLRAPSARALVGAARNLGNVAEDWRTYPGYDALVAVGPGVVRDLGWVPPRFRPRRTVMIPNGVPAAPPADPAGPVVRSTVAFAGRLRREKGVDLLLRALTGTTWTATIAGEGPERPALEALTHRLGLGGRVVFTGALDREGVANVLRAAEVVVLPSRRREGLPLVLLEAVRLGRRAVVSRQIAGSLPGDADAQVVPSTVQPRALAAAIRSALDAPAAEPHGPLAREFDIDVCAARYLDLFHELMGARSGTGT